MMIYLSRRDEQDDGVLLDSIKWAIETHLKAKDGGEFNYAEIFGNEDAPEYINFWYSADPDYGTPPDYTWIPEHWDMSDDEGWPDDEPDDCPF